MWEERERGRRPDSGPHRFPISQLCPGPDMRWCAGTRSGGGAEARCETRGGGHEMSRVGEIFREREETCINNISDQYFDNAVCKVSVVDAALAQCPAVPPPPLDDGSARPKPRSCLLPPSPQPRPCSPPSPPVASRAHRYKLPSPNTFHWIKYSESYFFLSLGGIFWWSWLFLCGLS